MTYSQLKRRGREVLSGNWGIALVTMVINGAISGLTSAILPGLGGMVVSGPMEFGVNRIYLSLQREREPSVEEIFNGFEHFLNCFLTGLLRGVFCFLWGLLLIVPGIVKSIAYSQAFFLLNDDPELDAMDVLHASEDLMDGHKMEYFLLQLSFLPWILLCIFIVPLFYVVPYISATNAAYYEYLCASQGEEQGEEEEPL